MKITANELSGIRAIEGRLAKNETNQVLEDLPPGHPLLEAVQTEQARSGDIEDLPDTHPLKVAIREAKERVIAKESVDSKQQESLRVKKAKRLKDSKEFRRRVDEEEMERERKRDCYKVINEKIDIALRGIDELLIVAKPDEETFGDDQFSRVRVARLQRLMMASRRGLADSRLRMTGV